MLPDALSRLYAGKKWGIRTHSKVAQRMDNLPTRELVELSTLTPPFVHVPSTDNARSVEASTTEPVLSSHSPSAPESNLGVVNINSLGVATTRLSVSWRPSKKRDSRPQPEVDRKGPVVGDHTASSADMVLQPPNSTRRNNGHPNLTAVKTPVLRPRTILPPTTEQLGTIKALHERSGHFGVTATYKSLSRSHKWMIHHVKQVVASCEICQRWSIVKRSYNPIRSPQAWWPFDIIQYDLSSETLPVTAQGNSVLLAAICVLTGFCFLRPLPDK